MSTNPRDLIARTRSQAAALATSPGVPRQVHGLLHDLADALETSLAEPERLTKEADAIAASHSPMPDGWAYTWGYVAALRYAARGKP